MTSDVAASASAVAPGMRKRKWPVRLAASPFMGGIATKESIYILLNVSHTGWRDQERKKSLAEIKGFFSLPLRLQEKGIFNEIKES